MTAPLIPGYSGGSISSCAGELSLCLQPGRVFDGAIQLRSRANVPIDWPVETRARLWFSWGTGTELIIPATIEGSWMYFHMEPAETEQVPRGSRDRLDLNYLDTDAGWFTWREGRIGSC